MTTLKTNPQAIARVLRRKGYKPGSADDHPTRWPALQCKRSGDEVRVRVWSNILDEKPTEEDRDTAAEIAGVLESCGYKIRYETGDYCLYVAGKESKS